MRYKNTHGTTQIEREEVTIVNKLTREVFDMSLKNLAKKKHLD